MIKVRQETQQKILEIIDKLSIEKANTEKSIKSMEQRLSRINDDLIDLRHIMEYLSSDETLK